MSYHSAAMHIDNAQNERHATPQIFRNEIRRDRCRGTNYLIVNLFISNQMAGRKSERGVSTCTISDQDMKHSRLKLQGHPFAAFLHMPSSIALNSSFPLHIQGVQPSYISHKLSTLQACPNRKSTCSSTLCTLQNQNHITP